MRAAAVDYQMARTAARRGRNVEERFQPQFAVEPFVAERTDRAVEHPQHVDAVGAQVDGQQEVAVLHQMVDVCGLLAFHYRPVPFKVHYLGRRQDASVLHREKRDASA